MRQPRAGRAFTLLEILAAVVILTIVASMAVMGYQGYRDRAAMLVDETNQKVLHAAVKLYAYDTHALPASLSRLRSRDLERAYALVTEGARPFTFLSYLGELVGGDVAEAQTLPPRYLGATPDKTLSCPVDLENPINSAAGISYAIPVGVAGRDLAWLMAPGNADVDLIIETDDPVTRALVYRHGGGRLAVVTTVGGKVKREPSPSAGTPPPSAGGGPP